MATDRRLTSRQTAATYGWRTDIYVVSEPGIFFIKYCHLYSGLDAGKSVLQSLPNAS